MRRSPSLSLSLRLNSDVFNQDCLIKRLAQVIVSTHGIASLWQWGRKLDDAPSLLQLIGHHPTSPCGFTVAFWDGATISADLVQFFFFSSFRQTKIHYRPTRYWSYKKAKNKNTTNHVLYMKTDHSSVELFGVQTFRVKLLTAVKHMGHPFLPF